MTNNRLALLKIGGGDELDLADLCAQASRLCAAGWRLVIVHGGGRALTEHLEASGIATRFVGGRRYTDDAVLNAALAVFCGPVNKRIVQALANAGVNAAGVSAVDGNLIRVRPYAEADLGWVGQIDAVNPALVETLLAASFVPVIAPLAIGNDGEIYNVNADTVAGALARALAADALVFASNVPGVLDAQGQTVPLVTPADAMRLAQSGAITGGMIPKLESALELLDAVKDVFIVDGSVAGSIETALSGRCGAGSRLSREAN